MAGSETTGNFVAWGVPLPYLPQAGPPPATALFPTGKGQSHRAVLPALEKVHELTKSG